MNRAEDPRRLDPRTPRPFCCTPRTEPTRRTVRLALGRRSHRTCHRSRVLEVATEPAVIKHDGRAAASTWRSSTARPSRRRDGHAKQLKDEIYRCPPILVLTGRPQDAWLATWSRAEAPCRTRSTRSSCRAVAALLRPRCPRPRADHPDRPRRTHDHLARACSARWSRGSDLPRRGRPPGRWARSSPARPRRPRSPASPWRCAPRARRSRRSPAWSTRCSSSPRRSRCRARPSTSSAPAATGRTRSTSPRWPRSSPPAPGARVVKHGNRAASSAVRRGRRARGARDPARPAARALAAGRRRGRHHFLLRRRLPPGAAARRRAAPRARHRRPRSTSSARWPTRPSPVAQAVGCADPRMAGLMAGVFAVPRRRRLGVPRRRRAGRADHDDHLDGVGVRRRRGPSGRSWTRWSSGVPRATSRTWSAETQRPTPRWYVRWSPATRSDPRCRHAQRCGGAGRVRQASGQPARGRLCRRAGARPGRQSIQVPRKPSCGSG